MCPSFRSVSVDFDVLCFMVVSGLKVVKTKTGVKHLHKAAVAFDLSVYFEANGHGTVLFSDAFLSRLALLRDHDGDNQSAKHLLEVAEIVNPSIGDALSIVLLVYVILTQVGLTIITIAVRITST